MKKTIQFETEPHDFKEYCNLILSVTKGKFIRLTIESMIKRESIFESKVLVKDFCQINPENIDILIDTLKELKEFSKHD